MTLSSHPHFVKILLSCNEWSTSLRCNLGDFRKSIGHVRMAEMMPLALSFVLPVVDACEALGGRNGVEFTAVMTLRISPVPSHIKCTVNCEHVENLSLIHI